MQYLKQLFTKYYVDEKVLLSSARLSTLYKSERIEDGQINLGDKIIASTSILTNSMILTANVNDFPRPFFEVVEEKLIFFKRRNNKKMIVFQLLKPNYDIINQRFSERKTN